MDTAGFRLTLPGLTLSFGALFAALTETVTGMAPSISPSTSTTRVEASSGRMATSRHWR